MKVVAEDFTGIERRNSHLDSESSDEGCIGKQIFWPLDLWSNGICWDQPQKKNLLRRGDSGNNQENCQMSREELPNLLSVSVIVILVVEERMKGDQKPRSDNPQV